MWYTLPSRLALSSRSRTKLTDTKGISTLVTPGKRRTAQSKVSGWDESVLQSVNPRSLHSGCSGAEGGESSDQRSFHTGIQRASPVRIFCELQSGILSSGGIHYISRVAHQCGRSDAENLHLNASPPDGMKTSQIFPTFTVLLGLPPRGS